MQKFMGFRVAELPRKRQIMSSGVDKRDVHNMKVWGRILSWIDNLEQKKNLTNTHCHVTGKLEWQLETLNKPNSLSYLSFLQLNVKYQFYGLCYSASPHNLCKTAVG